MSNATTSSPLPTAPTRLEDVVIGSVFTASCLLIIVAYVPCLVAMVTDAKMWPNSCIKVHRA